MIPRVIEIGMLPICATHTLLYSKELCKKQIRWIPALLANAEKTGKYVLFFVQDSSHMMQKQPCRSLKISGR